MNSVGPHSFRPLRWFDVFRGGDNSRCLHCFLPRNAHPIHCYVPSRPWHDYSPAELSWENLHAAE